MPRRIDGVWTSFHVKSLFFVAADPSEVPISSAALSYRLGLQLELVPMVDPLPLLPGDTLPIQVRYDGPELANTEVTLAWHADRSGGLQPVFRGTTDDVGSVDLPLAKAGHYRLTAIHEVHAGRLVRHHATMTFYLGELR